MSLHRVSSSSCSAFARHFSASRIAPQWWRIIDRRNATSNSSPSRSWNRCIDCIPVMSGSWEMPYQSSSHCCMVAISADWVATIDSHVAASSSWTAFSTHISAIITAMWWWSIIPVRKSTSNRAA